MPYWSVHKMFAVSAWTKWPLVIFVYYICTYFLFIIHVHLTWKVVSFLIIFGQRFLVTTWAQMPLFNFKIQVSQLNIGKLQTNLLLFAVLLCKVRLSRQRPLVTPLCLILNLTVGIIYKLMLNAILHFTYEIVTDHLMTEHLMIFSTLGSLSFTYECSPLALGERQGYIGIPGNTVKGILDKTSVNSNCLC